MFLSDGFCSWHERKSEGWAWYEERKKEEKIEATSSENTSLSASDTVKAWERELEELRSKAILEPTQENVGAYIAEQHTLLQNGHQFSREWMKFVLNTPQYDQTIQTPVSRYAVDTAKHLKAKRNKQFLKQLGSDYGFFFFFKSSCSYSQAFAEKVKEFSTFYDWEVVAISMDGGPCMHFPDSKMDNGISEKFSVSHVPSLFAVNPKENKVVPVAFGMISRDKIESNLLMQFEGVDNES
jgi:conjugal transfer pilus assembly protein TraF